jgi:hypothetical protein
MDHVTLWMPMLVLSVSEDLDKLFENCGVTAVASLRKLCGVVVMTEYLSIVLVIAVLGTKDGGAH